MIITVEVKFEIGETVYRKTDPEQRPHIVFGYLIGPMGWVDYRLVHDNAYSAVHEVEISSEKNPVLA